MDRAQVGADGLWTCTVSARERSDVIVFRGRALELLRTDLRLVKR